MPLITFALHRGRYVLTCVCLFVCYQDYSKLLIKSLWNFMEWLDIIQGPNNTILS